MFKPSHLSTPRTLADTTFVTGYTDKPVATAHDPADNIIFWGCFVAAVAFVAIMVFVPGAW